MEKLKRLIDRYWYTVSWVALLWSRAWIFVHPPEYVRYFEEYANIWYYGVPPYLKHWFEYPPATIPFISWPLWSDLAGYGFYRLNFRLMMLIADFLLIFCVMKIFQKMKYSNVVKFVGILFFAVMTVKAKDFMYDNLELLFTLSLFVPVAVAIVWPKVQSMVTWFSFWFGVGIKLVNAPLAPLYFFQEKQKPLIRKLIWPIVMFVVIWGAPLLMYRSSLMVIYIYHRDRVLQVESFPALISRGVNIFTKSEHIFYSQAKSYDIDGPVSSKLLTISKIALPLSMLVMLWYTWRHRRLLGNPYFLMKMTMIYIFSYLITNKVFSTPYHLWYLPFVIVYPYKNWRERILFFISSAIFMGVATTQIPNRDFWITDLQTFTPVATQIPALIYLFFASYQLEVPELVQAKKVPMATPEKKSRPPGKKNSPKR